MPESQLVNAPRLAPRQYELRIKQKGAAVYDTFTPQERKVVRLGLLPAGKMQKAEAELLAEFALTAEPPDPVDVARLLAVAIMDAANAGPDTMIV